MTLTENELKVIIQVLAKILEDNVNQRITVALANGVLQTVDTELRTISESNSPRAG